MNTLRYLLTSLLAFCLLLCLIISPFGRADVAIVVNPSNEIASLSRSEAINIFMGRYRKLPNGTVALPLDLVPLRARFYQALVSKDLSEINSYWARLILSGQTSPPQQIRSTAEIINIIENNLGAIGYLDSTQVADNMRVVFELGE